MSHNASDNNGMSTTEALARGYGATDASFNSGITNENSSKPTNSAAHSAASKVTNTASQTNFQTNSNANSGANFNTSAAKTVAGIFSSRSTAERAVNELRAQGFTSEEINIVSKKNQAGGQDQSDGFYDDDVSDGALTGSAIGGLGGLLLGAGAMAIPGVGPIVAAGPIAAALSGAAAGGLTGGLIDWGIPSEASERYEQNVAQGNILAIVKTTSSKVQQAAKIMRRNDAQDVRSHEGR